MTMNFFVVFINLYIIIIYFNKINTSLLDNAIMNNKYNSITNLLLKNKFSFTSKSIEEIVINFIKNNTNLDLLDENLLKCFVDIIGNSTSEGKSYRNYLNLLAYSGKGLSDLGLEDECIRYNFTYYLLTYEYRNGTEVTFSDQKNSFLFFQQNIFFTGICLPKSCNASLNFLFNETIDEKFYFYLKKELNIENAKVFDVGLSNETKDPTPTYENDGAYNSDKTMNEQFKYNMYSILRTVVLIILLVQIAIGIIIHIFYKPYIRAKEIRHEIDDDDSSVDNEDDNDENNQIFNITNEKEEKVEKSSGGGIGEFLYYYLSIFNNIKILLKKKNQYYNNNNLEIITFLRIICMILITFINNFEVSIKIPSKDFFYESFYLRYSFAILKFASFGVDMWICLDGFEAMYKLISYYKKYVLNKVKQTMAFMDLLYFYLYSVYKLISFYLFFLLVNYLNKYFIFYTSDKALFEYYSNHIYNDKVDNHQIFFYLIPGYSFYNVYNNKSSIFKDIVISKFSLLFINEFQIYTIFLIIFYISNLLKSKIFDYAILLLNFIIYFLNYWICQLEDGDRRKTYYSYKLVLDNFLTVRYPHIIFNYFFLGSMTGLTCFYYKDSFSNNSNLSDNENSPFRFCFYSIKIFDSLIQTGRYFWIILILILQIIICFSFNFLAKLNNNEIYIPFNIEQKIVLCYETGIFILLFCFIIIFLFLIKNENDNKTKNYYSLLVLIERTSFSFLNTINLVMYSYYCYFHFQLKLNYQNLWIITFGLFFLVCFENLVLTLAFVFLFKMVNKKIIKYLISPNKKGMKDIINNQSELLEKSRTSQSVKYKI